MVIEGVLEHPIFRIVSDAARKSGVRAFVIGGYVRDCFLGRPSKDIDIVVEGSGIDLAQKVGETVRSTVSVFRNFGTAMLRYHGVEIEFVGARKESYRRDSRKPIVLTGSQKPMGNPYTDAKLNIYQSILYALDDHSCRVSIVFNGKAVAGTRARKQRTRSFDAFESMNFPPLAIIHDDRIIRHYTGQIPAESDLKTYHHLNDRVFVLKLTPEVKADIFDLLKDSYDAIILETFGIGGIPEYDDSFEKAIFGWVDSGRTLAVTTQVPEEGCDLQVYQVGKKYSGYPGILQAGDMTTESIVAKIMWILGQTSERETITRLFEQVINLDRQEW